MSGQGPKSRWGSFLSQAVAGVEARLDTILAEDEPEKLPPPRLAPSPSPSQQSRPGSALSRSDSNRSRVNDRLQERLARAVAAKNAGQKPEASPTKATPTASPRQSLDVPSSRASIDSQKPKPDNVLIASPRALQDLPLRTSQDDASPPRKSVDAGAKPDKDAEDGTTSQRASVDSPSSRHQPTPAADGVDEPSKTSTPPQASPIIDLQEERIKGLEQALEELAAQQQEETHTYVEKIDALQAKLQYLAREATDAARKAAQEAPAGSMEKKLAEKDQQIAGLMEEGKTLATTEQKLRTVIKNLRSKIGEAEKDVNNIKTTKGKLEVELESTRKRSRRADDLEKYQEELHKRIGQSQKDIDVLRSEAAAKDRTIADLKAQLQKAADQQVTLTAKINDEALSKERQRARQLEDEVSELKVEKELAADRGRAQVNELQEKADRAAERSKIVEAELKAEMQAMESKLEAMRVRAEEVSSGAMGDSQAKLLRQVETLQSQYAIASDNWQGIESTLLARIASLEKERDDAQHRESEVRKKAREAAARARRQEEELEEAKTKIPSIQEDVKTYQSQLASLEKRAEDSEAALQDARAELEKQKSPMKEEKVASRDQDRPGSWLEDIPGSSFKSGSRPETPLMSAPLRSLSTELLGFSSLSSKLRKHSAPSSNGDPVEKYTNRRPSANPLSGRPSIQTGSSNALPPIFSPTTDAPPVSQLEQTDTLDSAETSSSPQQIVQDMVSVSTVGAGPSVQLVERMSAAIRRLETEKIATKEELTRISSQRDEARVEIVTLMREVDAGKKAAERVAALETEVEEVKQRYETTLEMLGEKSEMVEELKADVDDVKAMYRDLVERTIK